MDKICSTLLLHTQFLHLLMYASKCINCLTWCNIEYDGNGDEIRGLLGCSKIAAVEIL